MNAAPRPCPWQLLSGQAGQTPSKSQVDAAPRPCPWQLLPGQAGQTQGFKVESLQNHSWTLRHGPVHGSCCWEAFQAGQTQGLNAFKITVGRCATALIHGSCLREAFQGGQTQGLKAFKITQVNAAPRPCPWQLLPGGVSRRPNARIESLQNHSWSLRHGPVHGSCCREAFQGGQTQGLKAFKITSGRCATALSMAVAAGRRFKAARRKD